VDTLPVRLRPGHDLRGALMAAATGHDAFVLCGIGSLRTACIRFAGAEEPDTLHADFEILTLAGTLSADGPHLHISVSDAQGHVLGGHVASGCIVRTTAEVLLALLPEWQLSREADAQTGYAELVVRPRG
jgi:predicted DNA-binding protein with PD1-like motif